MPDAPKARSVNGTYIPASGVYDLDPAHTFAEFKARHLIIGRVIGRFNNVTGSITIVDDVANCTLDVTIDAASVDTKNKVRDEDLCSSHFLHVGHFPTINYRSTRTLHDGGSEWTVEGNLRVRDIERSVPLTVTYFGIVRDPSAKSRIGFTATAEIRRADFGITYELAQELGDTAVERDVSIEIAAEATLRA